MLSSNCSQLNPTKFILYTAIPDLMKKNPETVCLLRRSGKRKAHHSQISVPLHCLLGLQLTLNRHQLPLFTLKHDLSGNWQANLTSLAKGKEGARLCSICRTFPQIWVKKAGEERAPMNPQSTPQKIIRQHIVRTTAKKRWLQDKRQSVFISGRHMR